MASGRHRRSKSASFFEGISPSQKSKSTGRISPDNASYDDGSSSAQKFMGERGRSSSMRANESPMAKYLAEKVFKEAEPKNSSSNGMARLMRLEGLNSLWNNKQKAKLQDGHHQNNVSISFEPDRQPHGCLINQRMPLKKQQFSKVCDDPEASHFVNHRRSCEWSASSMPTEFEMGLTRQKIDTKHLSFGELIDVKPDIFDPLDFQYSKDILMNYARKLDSQQASSSSSHLERLDGLLIEARNFDGALTSHEISSAQAVEKKKKTMLPRPIIFPKSGIRDIPTVVESGSSLYHPHGNITNFRKTKEYPGAGTSKEITWRMDDSYHDEIFSKPISNANRKQAREIIRQLEDARFERENEMHPGSREFMVGGSSYDVHGSDYNHELDMHKLSSRNHSVDNNKWGRHPSRGHVNRDEIKRLLEALKVTLTYRDLELADDPTMLREVIDIPHGEARSNNFAYRGNDRSSARLGTDSRSSILGGPWSEVERASSRSRSLPPIEGRVHRRDTCLLSEEKHVMQSDPISRGRSRAVKGYPIRNNFLPSQASISRSKMPLPFPPIRIKERGSSLEATFEVLMEPNVEGVSETERDDNSGDTVYDKMVDEQEIATLPSELCVLHPRHSSEDNESSAADDDQEDFSVQGLRAGPPDEGSPSLNQLEAEPLVSENSYSADYASPRSVFDVEDASSNFERFNAELNELRMKLQLPKLDSGACDEISGQEDVAYPSSSGESWEDCYTLDVLIQSSFQEFGFDMLPLMWHDPDHPLDPTLFYTLEKKYGDDFPELRSERLLLFDRINSALSDIFQKRVDLHPFLIPKLGLHSTRVRTPTQDAVENLITQKFTNLQIVERILLREMQWAEPVEEFASIGKEIEELVLDDIIAEFVCDPSSLMDEVFMASR